MTTIIASRYHDISCGHRVYGHESKCNHLHGHNYRIHFDVKPNKYLDKLGRVLDFGVIKSRLCMWLEENWDHKFLVWQDDPALPALRAIDNEGVVATTFNPTAENMAKYLLETIVPLLLVGTDCYCAGIEIEETRKCSAIAIRD